MKWTDKQDYLIGPRMFGTYWLVLKIVVIVAVAGTILGNLIDWIVNGKEMLNWLGTTIFTALNAAIGAFGWITLVFAILERTHKEELVEEIKTEFESDHTNRPQSPRTPGQFSTAGSIAGIIFTIIFMIFINSFIQLLGAIHTISDGTFRIVPIIDVDVFRAYLPYINGILVLQLLFITSQLVLKKWTYGMAAMNLVINALSLLLVLAILGDTNIINPDFISDYGALMNVKGYNGINLVAMLFRLLQAVFAFAFTISSIQGFYNACQNSRS